MRNFDKKQLRVSLLQKRAQLSEASWRDKSLRIQKRILELAQWRQARCVLLYTAFRREVDTGLLFKRSLELHETTLLPRCLKSSHTLELVAVANSGQLTSGAYGILEPDRALCPQQCTCIPDIVFLPGVAFDVQGFRLGYGGGYYDRLLESRRLGTALRIGLGFDFQLLDALPTDPWDKPVHAICTEERFLWM